MNGFDNQEGWKCFDHEMVTDEVLEFKEAQYSILLRKELELRGEEVVDGPFGAKRDQLKPLLMEEHKFEVLHHIVTSCKRDDNKALFLLLQALPCILHMEMRVGIKLFTLMLVEGLKNAMLENSPMFPNETSMTERVTIFLKRAEHSF